MIKKAVALVLLLSLFLPISLPALAAETEEAPALSPLAEALHTLYATHMAHNTYEVFSLEKDKYTSAFHACEGEAESILACCQVVIPETRTLPKDTAQVSRQFMEIFFDALQTTQDKEGYGVVNTEKFETVYNETITLGIMPMDWWQTDISGTESLLAGPIFITDANKDVIDHALYLFGIFIGAEETTLWICADQDLIYDAMLSVSPPANDGKYEETTYMYQWLASRAQLEGKSDAFEEFMLRGVSMRLAASGGRRATAGTVTVTNEKSVNLRKGPSADSESVGTAGSGEILRVVGIAENGWYEVAIQGGTAFISPKMVKPN